MQQLQCRQLQQQQAWPQQHSAQRIVRQAAAPRLSQQARQKLHTPSSLLLLKRSHARRPSSTCLSAAADDVVRPSAHAAAPAAAPVDVTGATSSAAGSGYSSYADMYKALNSNTFSKTSSDASLNTTSNRSSSGPSSSSTSVVQPDAVAGIIAEPLSTASSNGHQHPNDNSSNSPALPATAGVDDAIRKAQQALAAAESSLSSIHKLRSAQPLSKWTGLLQLLLSVCIAAASAALLVASHAFGLGWQWAGATLGALGLAARAYQRETVTPPGAVVVAAACLATLGCSLRFGVVMLAYSYTSHKLRQFREGRPVVDYEAVSYSAQLPARDWPEVLCLTAVPTILAIAYGAMAGCLDLPLGSLPAVETWRADLLTLLQGAVLGWYSCCCGDAWSRELGEMSRDKPRLLTTLQPVRKGTHGAVTLLGLSGAAAGGLLMGLLFYCAAVLSPTLWVFDVQRQSAMAQWRLIPLGLIAGLFGSLVDSLLGATLQYTGFDSSTARLSSTPGPGVRRISGLAQTLVNDNLVNVLAASITAVLTALAALRMFG